MPDISPLLWILGLPLIAAAGLCLVPRESPRVLRGVSIAVTAVVVWIALDMLAGYGNAPVGRGGYRYVQQIPWVESLGISLHLGVDGINLGLLVMGAIVAFAAACVSREVTHRVKEYYVLLMLMTGGILGTFASLDIFFLYFFHELALVPTFIMIAVWGRGPDRQSAAFQITLYLTLGALVALVGLIALYLQSGARTFDLVTLTEHLAANPMPAARQQVIFPWLMFGLGILVSLWPFHTWAPVGYGAAPTATAMLHAGVLKKFGLYALLKVAVPLMPEGAKAWLPVLAWLCLGNILYCGWVAMRQKDLNLLIGNSSVAHVGFVFLGVASLTWVGVTGAVVVMVAHGFLAALSFALSGWLYGQTRSLDMPSMGGLVKPMPFVGLVMIMAMMAGCGLPGFGNFVGEMMVLFGGWKSGLTICGGAVSFRWLVAAAAWGALIVAALYMLRAIRAMFHGPPAEAWSGSKDPQGAWQRLPYAVLLASLLVLGVAPRVLTDHVAPSAKAIVDAVEQSRPAPQLAAAPAEDKR